MDSSRKILILHASAGHGHEKAARAVEEAAKAAPGVSVRCVDSLDFTPRFFGQGYKKSYLFLITRCAWFWGILYYAADLGWLYFFLRPLRRVVNALAAARLERLILEEKPDVVVSTHFLSTEVAAAMKKRGAMTARIVTVITDYRPHWFWIAEGVDRYAVAADETREELVSRGVDPSRVRVTGIPIGPRFGEEKDARALAQKLGLETGVFTVLLTSGGAGVGSAGRLVESLFNLEKKPQVAMICGTNKALLESMKKTASAQPRLKPFGFVDNMDEFMQVADVVVGKGGGLTVSESLAKGRPMIVFQPVPGQETRNAEWLKKRGAGQVAASLQETVAKTADLMASPDKLEAMKTAARRTGRPSAARDVLEEALRG